VCRYNFKETGRHLIHSPIALCISVFARNKKKHTTNNA
jgi:hypothetical protein